MGMQNMPVFPYFGDSKSLHMKIIVSSFFLLVLACSSIYSQTPLTYTSAEILLQIKKLNTLGSVLYVAAHPDDENTRLLAFFAKEKLYRSGYLSMTRGDGGQNLIGDEQGIALGLIRTQELMAARRIDGAEQFFTRAYDFGFSKTTEEAMRLWEKEKILSDVVWVIRKFQPDVILTRFPEDSRAGHGQHSASAVLAHEAFKAAADPNAFPEQLKYGVKPWQAKRILWNTFNFGGNNTTSADQLNFDVGVYNPILGKSYGEIAAESRSLHKSQGFGVARSRGQQLEFFTPIDGVPASGNLFDGINTTWARVTGGEKIQQLIDQLAASFSISNPEKSVPGLVNIYREISKLPDGFWKVQKQKEVQKIIEECSALWLESTTNTAYAVQGDSLRFSFYAINRLLPNVMLKRISVEGMDSSFNLSLATNKVTNFSKTLVVPFTKPVTQPYWLENEMSEGSFNVSDQLLIGNPESKPAYEIKFVLSIEGEEFSFYRPLQYKYTDPVRGEMYQPLTILPAVTGRFEPNLLVLNTNDAKTFDVITRKQSSYINGIKTNVVNTGNVNVKSEGNFSNGTYTYKANRTKSASQVNDARLLFNNSGKMEDALELRTIAYEHIPRIDYFQVPKLRLIIADIKTVGKRIGYIEGAGDKVPQALQQMGYEVVMLTEKNITPAYLKQFDAVISGIRAYNVNPGLADRYEVLMDYVKEGGNYIVQYNTTNFISSVTNRIGPYPFIVANKRITDERAKVNFLKPNHPVLNFPNKITEADFDNWIQERGIYFADRIDSKYESIFSMQDPGDAPLDGSLIVADYGKGKFVYTGLVFFRELPAGVPGAYRLLANIIALNYKKAF